MTLYVEAEKVPVGPLLRYVRSTCTDPLPQSAALRRAFHRATARGSLTIDAADRLAVLWLGVHPYEIWPDWPDPDPYTEDELDWLERHERQDVQHDLEVDDE